MLSEMVACQVKFKVCYTITKVVFQQLAGRKYLNEYGIYEDLNLCVNLLDAINKLDMKQFSANTALYSPLMLKPIERAASIV